MCAWSAGSHRSWAGVATRSPADLADGQRFAERLTPDTASLFFPHRHLLSVSIDRNLVGFGDFVRTGNGDVHVSNQSVLNFIDPTVNRQRLPFLPGFLNHRRMAHIMGLFHNVQFAKSIQPLVFAERLFSKRHHVCCVHRECAAASYQSNPDGDFHWRL